MAITGFKIPDRIMSPNLHSGSGWGCVDLNAPILLPTIFKYSWVVCLISDSFVQSTVQWNPLSAYKRRKTPDLRSAYNWALQWYMPETFQLEGACVATAPTAPSRLNRIDKLCLFKYPPYSQPILSGTCIVSKWKCLYSDGSQRPKTTQQNHSLIQAEMINFYNVWKRGGWKM